MSPQIQNIIFVVVALIAGYLFGLFDKRFTAFVRRKPESVEAPKPAAVEPAAPVEVSLPGEHTVLKVTVDPELKWHLELDGMRLDKPEEMSADQRQRAVNVVMQMRPWLDGKTAPAAAAAAAAQPAAAAPIAQQAKAEAAQIKPSAPVMPPTTNRDDLKISPLRGFNSLITKDVKSAVEKKPLSIVGMIDDVLQARLPSTPFKDRGIKLEEGPTGEVVVMVGSQSFSGIDSVPDPEIQGLIRAAISEWEKK